MPPNVENFYRRLIEALSNLPLRTKLGMVYERSEHLQLGYPLGNHEGALFWRFEASTTPIVMFFGFVQNFTVADLMCKVTGTGETVAPGEGASIQFNGNLSYVDANKSASRLQHNGLITVRSRVARSELIAGMYKLTPEVTNYFGGLDRHIWPLPMGNTDAPYDMLDAMFVWAYGIEQFKRARRGASMLPTLRLNASSTLPQ